MSIVLLTWELGGGMGHLVNLLPLVDGLRRRGHTVFAAVRDLSKAERVFGNNGVSLLQAPIRASSPANPIDPQRSFAHILHNHGFGDAQELRAMAGAWRNLFKMVAPGLVVFDHSPTALLAARGLPAKKALIGTGFFCPLDEYPLADLRPWMRNEKEPSPPAPLPRPLLRMVPGEGSLRQDEDRVLANANAVLATWGQPPLERLSRLFYDVDENFLATLPELEHYPGRHGTLPPCPSPATIAAHGARRGEECASALAPKSGEEDQKIQNDRLETYPTRGEKAALTPGPSPTSGRGEVAYWGAWPNVGGRLPQWPEGEGKRVFAYLKPFPALPRLLQQLCDLRCPTIVHGDGGVAALRARFRSASMRFEDEPLDLAEIGRSCDLAILNGNHGTTVSMLLAGKPTLQVPIFLEQGLFSQAVARLGAAIVATQDRPLDCVAGLMEMLSCEKHAQAARQFAARYADYDPQAQIAAVVERAEELARG